MRLFQLTKANILAFALLLPPLVGPVYAQSTDPQTKPENTALNKRDQSPNEATADQQKMNAADRALTAKIRRGRRGGQKASPPTLTNVKNHQSKTGTVTLKGPVRSDDEAKSIRAKATDGAGSPDKIVNQMSVKP
jgi:hypothetical protein